MLMFYIILAVIGLSLACAFYMFYQLKRQPKVEISFLEYIKLSISGIIAFFFDTIGVGSFALNIALAKLFGTFSDDEMPAVNNGAQVIPGMFESLFFMQFVSVDLTTLITLVAGTCIGGMLGGNVVSKLSKQAIRLAMIFCFSFIILLLLGKKFNLLPAGGDVIALQDSKLILGFFGMMLCGMLTSVGVGLFAMVQGLLFLLNVSPAVAFPIMTTAGALQQPLTTMMFLKNGKIPLKKTLILTAAGCVGVFITMPIFAMFSANWLHSLLILILIYNTISISRTYLKLRPVNKWPIEEPLAD